MFMRVRGRARFHMTHAQEKPGFYAFCSAPGATPDSFDFLIKRTPANDWVPTCICICGWVGGMGWVWLRASAQG